MTFTIYIICSFIIAILFGMYLKWRDIDLGGEALCVALLVCLLWPLVSLIVLTELGYNFVVYLKKLKAKKNG